jgi:hypothetical protein
LIFLLFILLYAGSLTFHRRVTNPMASARLPPHTTRYIRSSALNKCGLQGGRIYIPAFKTRDNKTVDDVIPHWTPGVISFFDVPVEFTEEWFHMLVRDANDLDAPRSIYRDGDSFIENVLTPNVEQICENVCIPRGNADGSLIEMYIAGANMSTSEPVLETWQKLVVKTIRRQMQEEMQEETQQTAE